MATEEDKTKPKAEKSSKKKLEEKLSFEAVKKEKGDPEMVPVYVNKYVDYNYYNSIFSAADHQMVIFLITQVITNFYQHVSACRLV